VLICKRLSSGSSDERQEAMLKGHKETNKSENGPTAETQLVEIEKKLGCMEKRLEQIQRQSRFQWRYSIGFGGMAVGAGMITAGASSSNTSFVPYGVLVFFLGVAVMVISSNAAK